MRCTGTTKRGKPCQAGAERGFDTCPAHRPTQAPAEIPGVFQQETTCYRCIRYAHCFGLQLADRTWAWLCDDCACTESLYDDDPLARALEEQSRRSRIMHEANKQVPYGR